MVHGPVGQSHFQERVVHFQRGGVLRAGVVAGEVVVAGERVVRRRILAAKALNQVKVKDGEHGGLDGFVGVHLGAELVVGPLDDARGFVCDDVGRVREGPHGGIQQRRPPNHAPAQRRPRLARGAARALRRVRGVRARDALLGAVAVEAPRGLAVGRRVVRVDGPRRHQQHAVQLRALVHHRLPRLQVAPLCDLHHVEERVWRDAVGPPGGLVEQDLLFREVQRFVVAHEKQRKHPEDAPDANPHDRRPGLDAATRPRRHLFSR
mmetsp:Transcript_13144/g.45492  ORF Transcript_13144/g.45492 Transcript_13144/m.45492 type:complete len:264 (-) Transcript_13144:376-1167(-)